MRLLRPARLAGVAAAAPLVVVPLLATPAQAASQRNDFHQFTHGKQWRAGHSRGTVVGHGAIRIGRPHGQRTLHGVSYDSASWTSGWYSPGQRFSQLIPSWNAETPRGTWLSVTARVRAADGTRSSWQSFGHWTKRARGFARTSLGRQDDGRTRVLTDTLVADGGRSFTAYQLRVHLYREAGSRRTPTVRSVHAVVSRLAGGQRRVSRPLHHRRVVLDVPRYSQMIHAGEYPRYGGGGEAWCSPTSLAMVLGYYDALPGKRSYRWVRKGTDRWVDQVARMVFDHGYHGTGNWPFNTAWAATRGKIRQAFVTRLTDLRGAERFIAAGIPLVASIAFGRGQLDGAPIGSTAGHLVVIVGFTRSGDVIVNDPAAPTNASVRRTYDRAQFEAAWQRSSHGMVYAVRDAGHRFPRGYAG